MRPDHEIDRAVLEPVERRLLLRRGDEPRQQPDLDRERGEPLAERLVVLGGEDGRRDEDRDLLAVLDRLERGPQGDLGLAVADVADDEPVHRPAGLHVELDLGGGAELVGRLLVREARLHLGLPRRVGREGVALRVGPRRVQLEQLLGEVRDGLPDPLLRLQPLGAAELAQLRVLGAAVARDPGDLLDRDEDLVAAGEAQLEVVAVLALGVVAAPEHPLVAGDAVVDVDDEVAGRQALEDVARDDPPHRLRPADADGPEQLAIGDERETVRAAVEAAVQAALDERDRAGRRGLRRVDDRRGVAGLLEQLREARRLVAGEDDPRRRRPASARRPRRSRRAAAGGQLRLAPAEQVAGAQAARGERRPVGRAPTPRSARASGRRRAGVFQSRGPRYVDGQSFGRSPLSISSARRSSAWRHRNVGGLGDLAGLVEDEEGRRRRGGRGRSTGRAGRPRPRRRRRRSRARRRRRSASGIARAPSPSNRARSAASRSGSFAAARPRRSRSAATPSCGARNSDAGRRIASLERSDRPLVGRVERPQRVDLVAEELDPDRQRRRRREHVDDPAAPGELAAAGDLGWRARSRGRAARGAARPGRSRPPTASRRGSAGRSSGRDRVLERAPGRSRRGSGRGRSARPTGPRRGPPSRRRRARSARRRGRSAARGRRRPPGRRARPPSSSATRSPISASRAIQTSRSPPPARARVAARYDFAPWGTELRPTWRPVGRPAARAAPPTGASRSRRLGERAGRGEQRRQRREIRAGAGRRRCRVARAVRATRPSRRSAAALARA